MPFYIFIISFTTVLFIKGDVPEDTPPRISLDYIIWMHFYVQIQDVSSTCFELHGCNSRYELLVEFVDLLLKFCSYIIDTCILKSLLILSNDLFSCS